jgi:hypothetical protein
MKKVLASFTVLAVKRVVINHLERRYVMKTMEKGLFIVVLLVGLSALSFAAELPIVTIMAPDPQAVEGKKDPADFVITRTGEVGADLTVFYTVGGTATNGKDYKALPGNVKIPAGADSVIIEIFALADRETEGTETVILTLIDKPEYDLGESKEATIRIIEKK